MRLVISHYFRVVVLECCGTFLSQQYSSVLQLGCSGLQYLRKARLRTLSLNYQNCAGEKEEDEIYSYHKESFDIKVGILTYSWNIPLLHSKSGRSVKESSSLFPSFGDLIAGVADDWSCSNACSRERSEQSKAA
jgi:hypothetical protein